MTFPALLAHGVDLVGRQDWNDVIVDIDETTSAQAADGVAIAQFDVLTYDVDGRLTQWLATSEHAQGTITFTGNPSNSETMALNGETITFVTTLTTGAQVHLETLDTDTAANLVDLVNGDPDTYAVTASVDTTGLIVTFSAIEAGVGGNAITLTESLSNATVSGATLTGATADRASGLLSFTGVPANADTLTINGQAITFVNGAPGTDYEVTRDGGATATDVAQDTKAVINGFPGDFAVTAAGSGITLALSAIAEGAAGNLVTLAHSSTQPVLSGATLTGGAVAEDAMLPGPIAVAMEAVPAATPGSMVPICTDGVFNHTKLGWPVSVATLAQRRRALANSSISVIAFL